ncbi:hypothetical protein AB9K34_05015 [Sedimentitalea sp. XS_ASV28]|uniref:hypothetical protein n=1 Tax=Sedimentitalea sp. XS_ASV28 TaxID=3241296 RepID=UPI0035159DA7
MSLRIHPDPQEPAGGYAFLELEADSLADEPVRVAVFDAYAERWLAPPEANGVGGAEPHWQSERHEFGPYEVYRHDGADWVRIGPEIVDQLGEYAPLRFMLADQVHDTVWPDDVPPRAGAAMLGGLQPVGRKRAELIDRRVAPAVIDDPDDDMRDDDAQDDGIAELPDLTGPEDADKAPGARRGRFWLVLLLAILIAAALAWYFRPEPAPDPAPRVVAESAAPCTRETLAATDGGFGAIAEAIRACGSDVQPDTALSLVEEAAARDDADALLLFGVLYDGEALDPRIENLTGLTFADDPAQAVEYYARARDAGSGEARTRLEQACARLASDNATLARGAFDDFCS